MNGVATPGIPNTKGKALPKNFNQPGISSTLLENRYVVLYGHSEIYLLDSNPELKQSPLLSSI